MWNDSVLNPNRVWEERELRYDGELNTKGSGEVGVYITAPTLLCLSDNINSPASVLKTI